MVDLFSTGGKVQAGRAIGQKEMTHFSTFVLDSCPWDKHCWAIGVSCVKCWMDSVPAFSAQVTGLGTPCPVIAARGEVDLATVPILVDSLACVLSNCLSDLVLDLSETTFMDCSGIASIVEAKNRMSGEARIILREPLPLIQRILAILEMDSVCVIESRVA